MKTIVVFLLGSVHRVQRLSHTRDVTACFNQMISGTNPISGIVSGIEPTGLKKLSHKSIKRRGLYLAWNRVAG